MINYKINYNFYKLRFIKSLNLYNNSFFVLDFQRLAFKFNKMLLKDISNYLLIYSSYSTKIKFYLFRNKNIWGNGVDYGFLKSNGDFIDYVKFLSYFFKKYENDIIFLKIIGFVYRGYMFNIESLCKLYDNNNKLFLNNFCMLKFFFFRFNLLIMYLLMYIYTLIYYILTILLIKL